MKHVLLEQWYNFQREPSDDVDAHTSKLQNLCQRLKAAGEEISDEALTIRHFPSSWHSTAKQEKTIENLVARLKAEEMSGKFAEKQEPSALFSRGRGRDRDRGRGRGNSRGGENRGGSSKNNRHSNMKCYNCGELGHISYDCESLKKGDKNNSNDQRNTQRHVLNTAQSEPAEKKRKKDSWFCGLMYFRLSPRRTENTGTWIRAQRTT